MFVSHNMQAVSTLTTRCLLLQNGRAVFQGTPQEVIARYLDSGLSRELAFRAPGSPDTPTVTGVEIETSEPNNTHRYGEPLRLRFELTTPVAIPSATLSFQIVDPMLQPVADLWVIDSDRPFCREPRTYHLTCEIPCLPLYLGRYAITAHLSGGYGGVHFPRSKSVRGRDVLTPERMALAGRGVPLPRRGAVGGSSDAVHRSYEEFKRREKCETRS